MPADWLISDPVLPAAGNLGQGSVLSYQSPRQVSRMRGKGIQSVACSDGCSAAIASNGWLYTWGSGAAGQLGHGDAFPVVEPKRVIAFGDEVKIHQVRPGLRGNCGLGLGGVEAAGQLGHCNISPVVEPKRVVVFGGEVRTPHVQMSCGPRSTWPSPCPPATLNLLRNLPPLLYCTANGEPHTHGPHTGHLLRPGVMRPVPHRRHYFRRPALHLGQRPIWEAGARQLPLRVLASSRRGI